MEGKMHTTAGMEVIFFFFIQSLIAARTSRMKCKNSLAFHFQIDRASAGNVKRSKEEIEADPEQENEFGYTMSK